MDRSKIEPCGGFSHVKIILSDALPSKAFHPDFPDYDPNKHIAARSKKEGTAS